MKARALFLLSLTLVLQGLPTTPARAGVVHTGVCSLDITLQFSGTPLVQSILTSFPVPTSPEYGTTVSGLLDLDTSALGKQSCIYPQGGTNGLLSTSVTMTPGSLTSDIWACEFAHGFGNWEQSWDPLFSSAWQDTTYEMVGTWGAWTMIIRNADLHQVAVVALTFKNPTDAVLLAEDCHDGSEGVAELQLAGVEYFVGVLQS